MKSFLIYTDNAFNDSKNIKINKLFRKNLLIDSIDFPKSISAKHRSKLATKISLLKKYDFIIFLKDRSLPLEELIKICKNSSGEKKIFLLTKEKKKEFFINPLYAFFLAIERNILADNFFATHEILLIPKEALLSVPYELNGNSDLYLLELLLQMIHIKVPMQKIVSKADYEFNFKTEKERFFTILHYKLHELGIFCLLKYQNIQPLLYRDKTFIEYSSHKLAIDKIKQINPKTVLDIGCGPGFIGKRCEENGITVTGLDRNQPLKNMLSHFFKADIDNNKLPVDLNNFDLVIMLDIIEHLSNPEDFLLMMRNSLTFKNSKSFNLLLSTPNIAFFSIRLNLLLGRFNYAERGILDITHKRLFTKDTLFKCLEDCGYEVQEFIPIGIPFAAVLKNGFGDFLGKVSNYMAKLIPTLFAFQFMILAKPKEGLNSFLYHYPIKQNE